jgi:hypothetical protein
VYVNVSVSLGLSTLSLLCSVLSFLLPMSGALCCNYLMTYFTVSPSVALDVKVFLMTEHLNKIKKSKISRYNTMWSIWMCLHMLSWQGLVYLVWLQYKYLCLIYVPDHSHNVYWSVDNEVYILNG